MPQNHYLFFYLLTKYYCNVTATQVAKRDETVLSLQSELDATQQEYETCSAELSERETEVAEMKTKIGQLEAELKGLKAQRESDESKVSYINKVIVFLIMFSLINCPFSREDLSIKSF